MKTEKYNKEFYCGSLHFAYKYFGCKYVRGAKEAVFTVFAPHAENVFVMGDFNNWSESASPLKSDGGIWSAVIANVNEFDGYKFVIDTHDGRRIYKSDPYAFHSETAGLTNSKVYDISAFKWTDAKWEKDKRAHAPYDKPVNIYEAHIGSWRRYEDGNQFSYKQFASEIVPYLKHMNYTHIELMGIAEYPFEGSWGYQVTGYYAPTSRYGTPDEFAFLINELHVAGIGVILDWVPGHFPKDANGLYEFDGQPLYEPEDELKKEHKEWGTRCFDYCKGEVKSFLISNALYWLDVFHIDGLRVDAVASMLYLDYNRTQWRPNKDGGKENLEAIEFFKELNTAVFAAHPGTIMVAEESTAFPLVTMPVSEGGLGFNFKWNMGWMNDTLGYVKTDPYFRWGRHNALTFSMSYAFSENYILPISHDEVVHGKGSLLNKMPGNYETKFAGWRNYLMSMFSHPGKKLTFMGAEIAQFIEWDYKKELDWKLLDFPAHKSAQEFFKTLSGIYKETAALWQIEDSWDGFEWLVVDDYKQNVLIYERKDRLGDRLIAVYNFSPLQYLNYAFGCGEGTFTVVLSSSLNGWNTDKKTYKTQNKPSHNKKTSIIMDIAPMSGIYMVCKAKKTKKENRASK